MPNQRKSMRKIKKILRMSWSMRLSNREVARAVKVGRDTVAEYLIRAANADLSHWSDVERLDDGVLEGLLFPPKNPALASKRPLPDWSYIDGELRKRKGVTLFLLWEEYVCNEADEKTYSYSHFCSKFNDWRGKLPAVMVQDYTAGELTLVDYAGLTVPYIDRFAGLDSPVARGAQIFVAALGASSYTYAEAQESQKLPSWCEGHVNAFDYFEGVTVIVVPDNLKSGVTSPCYYEPEINPTYDELSLHYGFAVIPARVRKPKDKAKAETAVQVVEQRILAPLRNRTFFSIQEINDAMAPLLEKLNNRKMQHLEKSRRELYLELDRPALNPLPKYPFEESERARANVGINYHVSFKKHYYSVPFILIKEKVEIRATTRTIEIFSKGIRVACHLRNDTPGRYSTSDDHMPENHIRRKEKWSPERFIRWAGKYGPDTRRLIEGVIESKKHPEQAYRSCLGILKMADVYSPERLEAACKRALILGLYRYRNISNILKTGQDKQPFIEQELKPTNTHNNVRGSDYYN